MSNKFWRPGDLSAPKVDAEPSSLRGSRGVPQTTVIDLKDGKHVGSSLNDRKVDVLRAIESKRTVLISAASNESKVTKIPQFLFDAGWASENHSIAVALPTRSSVLAATSSLVLERGLSVDEIGGSIVGYDLPLQRRRSSKTSIIFFSNSSLAATIRVDPLLFRYSVIVVDDVHDRSISLELLVSLLRVIQKRRGNLRVVLMFSSTEIPEDFLVFFGGHEAVNVVQIPHRLHLVRVHYASSPVRDYLETSLELVKQKFQKWRSAGMPVGSDVLIFVPDAAAVSQLCDTIAEWAAYNAVDVSTGPRLQHLNMRHAKRPRHQKHGSVRSGTQRSSFVIPLPLHASLSPAEQLAALQLSPPEKLKVVVSTSIAEISLSVDGIATVIDSGLESRKVFTSTSRTARHVVVPLSQKSAAYRSGCAGRSPGGVCYRLYTREYYDEHLAPDSPPEMLCSDITTVLLSVKALGVRDISTFKFVVPPPLDAFSSAMSHLHNLGALRADGNLTTHIGERLSEIPLPPNLARVLLAGEERGVGRLVAIGCSMLFVSRSVFAAAGSNREQERAREVFSVAEGDVVTLINVYRRFISSKKSVQWCEKHKVSISAMQQVMKTSRRLTRLLNTARPDPRAVQDDAGLSVAERVCRCFAAGLFSSASFVRPDGVTYINVLTKRSSKIHPTSVLFGRAPSWVVAVDSSAGSGTALQNVCTIRPEWLAEDLPSLFRRRNDEHRTPGSDRYR